MNPAEYKCLRGQIYSNKPSVFPKSVGDFVVSMPVVCHWWIRFVRSQPSSVRMISFLLSAIQSSRPPVNLRDGICFPELRFFFFKLPGHSSLLPLLSVSSRFKENWLVEIFCTKSAGFFQKLGYIFKARMALISNP